jgi:hypothetical protein
MPAVGDTAAIGYSPEPAAFPNDFLMCGTGAIGYSPEPAAIVRGALDIGLGDTAAIGFSPEPTVWTLLPNESRLVDWLTWLADSGAKGYWPDPAGVILPWTKAAEAMAATLALGETRPVVELCDVIC